MNRQRAWLIKLLLTAFITTLTGCGGTENVKSEGENTEPQPILQPKNPEDLPWRYAPPTSEVTVLGTQTEESPPEGAELAADDLVEPPAEEATEDKTSQTFEPIIHFGYNQDILDDEAMQTIEHYAKIVTAKPMVRVKLLGHTDERGTPEYNLALGERRAKAVKNAMMVFGVAPERIEIISYGEEKPLVDAHNEAAWAQNRRVEIEIY